MESFQHSQIMVFRLFVSKIGPRHLAYIIYHIWCVFFSHENWFWRNLRRILRRNYTRRNLWRNFLMKNKRRKNAFKPMWFACRPPNSYIRSSLVRDNCIWWLLWRLPLHLQIPNNNVWSLRNSIISQRKHDEFQNCSKQHTRSTYVTLVTSVTAIKVTTLTRIVLASGYSWVYAAPSGYIQSYYVESDN